MTLKAMQMSLLINSTQITVKDDLFINAYQEGYLKYKRLFEGQPISDERIYDFIAQDVYFPVKHDVENAGYITGWFAGLLFEHNAQSSIEERSRKQSIRRYLNGARRRRMSGKT